LAESVGSRKSSVEMRIGSRLAAEFGGWFYLAFAHRNLIY